ncbi:MAG: hypothetical protein LBP87_13455 [Planctomycetaceae bacterium]|jgi:hypothetical protein|nr:hypothetical protein [Planctomycetaceae bacterium]
MSGTYVTVGDNGQNVVRTAATAGGLENAGAIPALDAGGKLHGSMMPSGLGVSVQRLVTSETVAGLVNIWFDATANEGAGSWFVRKADATDETKPAHGFVKVTASSGEEVDVYLEGTYALTSTLPEVYLSITPGVAGAYDPTAKIRQLVGRRVGVNTYIFIPGDITVLNPSAA